MTSDGLDVLTFLLQNLWYFFNSWYIPGTTMTPAAFLFFCAFLALVVPWFKKFFSSL